MQIRAWNNSAEDVGKRLMELHSNLERPAVVFRHLIVGGHNAHDVMRRVL